MVSRSDGVAANDFGNECSVPSENENVSSSQFASLQSWTMIRWNPGSSSSDHSSGDVSPPPSELPCVALQSSYNVVISSLRARTRIGVRVSAGRGLPKRVSGDFTSSMVNMGSIATTFLREAGGHTSPRVRLPGAAVCAVAVTVRTFACPFRQYGCNTSSTWCRASIVFVLGIAT